MVWWHGLVDPDYLVSRIKLNQVVLGVQGHVKHFQVKHGG